MQGSAVNWRGAPCCLVALLLVALLLVALSIPEDLEAFQLTAGLQKLDSQDVVLAALSVWGRGPAFMKDDVTHVDMDVGAVASL